MTFVGSMDGLKHSLKSLMDSTNAEYSVTMISAGKEIRIDSDRQFRGASVVKLFILITLYRRIQDEYFKETDMLKMSDDTTVDGGVMYCLSPLSLTVKDLATLMIVVSDNTASNLLLKYIGFETVAETLRLLRTEGTCIARYFGDQRAVDEGKENYTTGNDIIIALECIAKENTLIRTEYRYQMINMLSSQQFRHKLPSYFDEDGPISIFNKTGELKGIEHDVGLISVNQRFDYIAVLTSGWDQNATGQRKISLLGKLVYNTYVQNHENIFSDV